MENSVWLDKKGYLKNKSDNYADCDIVVLCYGINDKILSIETDPDCFAGAWISFEEAAEDLWRTGFELLGEL